MKQILRRRAFFWATGLGFLVINGCNAAHAIDEQALPIADAPLNPLSSIEPSDLIDFINRPLFNPSRQRPVPRQWDPLPTPTPTMVEATQPLEMDLLGIVVSPLGRSAFVRDIGADRQQVLHIGDEFQGWIVETINADAGLTMVKGIERKTFVVFKSSD